MGPGVDYLERAFDHAKYGELSEHPWLDVTIPSVLGRLYVAPPEVPATTKIYVGVGRKDGATANDLVAVLTKELRVNREKIGRVELRDAYSLVELPAEEAERIAGALTGKTIRRKRVTARVDRGPAKPARPSRPPQRRA